MKLSMQTGDVVDRLGIEKGYKIIKESGFDAIDWNLDHAWKQSDLVSGNYRGKCIFEKPLDKIISHYENELKAIKANGLEITQAHAPFAGILRKDPSLLDYAIEVYKGNILYCDYIGCKNLVIHGLTLELSDDAKTQEDIHRLNMKMYSSLIPTIKNTNVTVCLENLFVGFNGVNYAGHCSYFESGKADIDYLNSLSGKESFGICIDTGHANLLHQDIRDIIYAYDKRIKCLHIHDNNGQKDEHQAPLTGTISWMHFCQALKAVGYTGDLSFETFNQLNMVMDFSPDLAGDWL